MGVLEGWDKNSSYNKVGKISEDYARIQGKWEDLQLYSVQ